MSDSGRTLSDPCEKCRTFHNGPCKPAATGSGEPKCPTCGTDTSWSKGWPCWDTWHDAEPTPPASQPTVTQDAQGELHKALRCVAIDDVRFHINEALALLRAAEQK